MPLPTVADHPFMPVVFHFWVSCGGDQEMDASFQEVTGLSSEMETEAVNEGGENRYVLQLPKALKNPRLTLKRGIAPLSSPLVTWCKQVLEGGLGQPIKPRVINLALLNEEHEEIRVWSLMNAYPVKWAVSDFHSTKNELVFETLEFNYTLSLRKK